MRKAGVVCCMLLFVCCIHSLCWADIIKLKKGVSFEGNMIEEKEDVYVMELDIGVIEFKKDEVQSIEVYSSLENVKMIQEWEETKQAKEGGEQQDGEMGVDDQDSFLRKKETVEQLVRYKGRYITPEVHEILTKEREIKERRYKFLKDQRRKQWEEELTVSKKDEILNGEENADSAQSVTDGQKMETRKFGSANDTRKLGSPTREHNNSSKNDVIEVFTPTVSNQLSTGNTL
ncbi:MAG: hypothetical protein KKH94_11940 [Candidatus Omnitrophica bacterium]|nr:hypothetical protein [Candidatus Omnitrophota bacterium]